MLSINNLNHIYANGVQALNNINLTIKPGMFGLLGPNGAGKSSLMRTLATLQKPSSGNIDMDGIDVLATPEKIRRLLGYLPQDFGLYPRATAHQLLHHIAILKGLTSRKDRIERVDQLLVQTNLSHVRHHALSTYSGGMRQRFGIAQALLGQPKLIIVDEPTAGLDPEERNRFHNLLAEIGQQVIVILSTHIVGDVNNLCANMAILNHGCLIKQNTPQALINEIDGHMWQKTIEKSELVNLAQSHRVISHHLSMGRTVVRVFAEADPGNGFQTVAANLEDVYFCAIDEVKNSQLNSQNHVGERS